MAAAMGADEYGFGSVAMIATGCVMARICHTNNCPVGVASQVIGRPTCHSFLRVGDAFNIAFFAMSSERRTACSLSWSSW